MKNLKKLSRGEMKTVGGGEPGKFACCNSSGQCSSAVYGDSNDLYCVDAGTTLVKSNQAFTEGLN